VNSVVVVGDIGDVDDDDDDNNNCFCCC